MSLIEQAGAGRQVLVFERLDDPAYPDHAYYVGTPDAKRLWQPRSDVRTATAWMHRVAEWQGAFRDITPMLEGRTYARPRQQLRDRLLRVAEQIGGVCPQLGAALRSVESETDGDRIVARITARGFELRT